MNRAKNNYDVAVIGAGPAGMMAGISAARCGAKTVLIEKNELPGRKLLLTGGGRCNIANFETDLRQLVAAYGKSGAFLFHAFSEFGPKDAVNFFNKAGVETAIENNRRVFPKSGKAQDVLDALLRLIDESGAELVSGNAATKIEKKENSISEIILADGRKISAKSYIIATGGKSYPGTGSTGNGYDWAHDAGHRIIKLAPALVPIRVKEEWAKELTGVCLPRAGMAVSQNKKKMINAAGEILFTHFGLSGPAILNASAAIGELLEAGEVAIHLNIFCEKNRDQLEKMIIGDFSRNPNKTLKNCLAERMPSGLAPVVAQNAGIDPAKTVNMVTREERRRLVQTAQNLELTVSGLLEMETGMVTAGGVDLKNIDDKTMRSRIVNNLFFAGEIISVHGRTGGFNLQQSWSTGRCAGLSAARFAKTAKADRAGSGAASDLQIRETE